MKKILILEDSIERCKLFEKNFINADITFVDTSNKAIELLKNQKFDYIFLDHDLGGTVFAPSDEKSGYAAAKFLEENSNLQPKIIIIHSLNPTGQEKMRQALPNAKIAPFVWNYQLDFDKII